MWRKKCLNYSFQVFWACVFFSLELSTCPKCFGEIHLWRRKKKMVLITFSVPKCYLNMADLIPYGTPFDYLFPKYFHLFHLLFSSISFFFSLFMLLCFFFISQICFNFFPFRPSYASSSCVQNSSVNYWRDRISSIE